MIALKFLTHKIQMNHSKMRMTESRLCRKRVKVVQLVHLPTDQESAPSFESLFEVDETSVEVVHQESEGHGGVDEMVDGVKTKALFDNDLIDRAIDFGLLDKPKHCAARVMLFKQQDCKDHVKKKKVVKVVDNQRKVTYKWEVIDSHIPPKQQPLEYNDIGICLPQGFDSEESKMLTLGMCIHMLPGLKVGDDKVWDMIDNINHWIQQSNISTQASRKVREILEWEFYGFIVTVLMVTGYAGQRSKLRSEPSCAGHSSSVQM